LISSTRRSCGNARVQITMAIAPSKPDEPVNMELAAITRRSIS
jgi:hypothetical protein